MNITALITGTILIILFSWSFSIKHKRYHGIPRFFSFESIYLLVLLNIKVWFQYPFSMHQIISWILLILSAYVGLAGFLLLKRRGKSTGNFENTTILIKSGVYSLTRHPLYFSLILLGTGVMMKDPDLPALILGVINLIAVYLTAMTEEKEMVEKFGEPYREYMKETKMFIPFIL
ncbi:MAG: isoprenylcysteine carboxylmethyltransferase family protein [Bacteroidia bacterium]|nr:isoprenylcysteine carboxylmethyltransferase family protein [Bacteroidia bacterium]